MQKLNISEGVLKTVWETIGLDEWGEKSSKNWKRVSEALDPSSQITMIKNCDKDRQGRKKEKCGNWRS